MSFSDKIKGVNHSKTLFVTRVSTPEQEKNNSKNTQRNLFIKDFGKDVKTFYNFTISAFNKNYLNRIILPIVKEKDYEEIIAMNGTRFCRNFSEFVAFIDSIERPITITFMEEEVRETFQPRGVIPENFQRIIKEGEIYSRILSKNSKASHKRRKDEKEMLQGVKRVKLQEDLPEGIYNFESILERIEGNPIKYRVKWENGEESEEPRTHLMEYAKVYVDAFEKEHKLGKWK